MQRPSGPLVGYGINLRAEKAFKDFRLKGLLLVFLSTSKSSISSKVLQPLFGTQPKLLIWSGTKNHYLLIKTDFPTTRVDQTLIIVRTSAVISSLGSSLCMLGEDRKPLLIPLRHCSGEGSTTTSRLLCGGLCICAAERVLLSSE